MTRAVAMAERKYRHPQVNLRLPEDLKEKIANLAKRNRRSTNAEMVEAIEEWIRKDEVYNYRSETSLLNSLPEGDIDDEDTVTMPKGNLSQIINEAAEEAAQTALHILLDRYDIVAKENKKPPK